MAVQDAKTAVSAPAWRQFAFFASTTVSDAVDPGLSPEALRQPSTISALAASPESDLLLSADLDGFIHILTEDYEIKTSWRAYGNDTAGGGGGRCTHIVIAQSEKWRGTIVTLGEEAGSQYPVIKVWDSRRSSVPVLLRASKIQYSTRPHPVSALSVSSDLSYVVIASADGTVVAFRHLDQLLEGSTASSNNGTNGTTAASSSSSKNTVLGLGKLKTIHEGKDPITGLGFRITLPVTTSASSSRSRANTTLASTTLFILTTNQVLSVQLSGTSKPGVTVLDDFGAGVSCSAVMEGTDGGRLVVAREEAIYVYGEDGREGCHAYEGPKSAIFALSQSASASSVSSKSNYIAIVTPPLAATASSSSATLRTYARAIITPSSSSKSDGRTPSLGTPSPTNVARVTIFDLENKFVAHTGTFEEGVRDVWEAWNAIWVLTEGGKLYRLAEQPISASLSTLFSRNLYALAVSLGQSRGLPPSEIAEIYRRYGDYLYSKSDFEGSMGCYLKTVGTVQASYVIRKFLDAQRLSHLTSYLQELHSRGLANSDHTTLLLNCYTKLADECALSSFIHSSASARPILDGSTDTTIVEVPPFDLETAIRVCRQAGYFEHAVWLAQRYGEHQEYLRIQIEDRNDYHDSLRYIRKLGVAIAEDSVMRYGKTLLDVAPEETTQLLIDLCCGTLEREEAGAAVVSGNKNGTASKVDYRAYLAYAIPDSIIPGVAAPATIPVASTPTPAISTLRKQASTTSVLPNRKSGIDQSSATEDSAAPSISDQIDTELPRCRQFFASFVDHPHHFITFLETVAERRWGKTLSVSPVTTEELPLIVLDISKTIVIEDDLTPAEREEQSIFNTLLELYLSHGSGSDLVESPSRRTASSDHSTSTLEAKALSLLRSKDTIPYDATHALLVCTTAGFSNGFILLYEQLGMYDEIIRYWIEASLEVTLSSALSPAKASSKVISALRRYGPHRLYLYKLVLAYLTTSSELLSRHQNDLSKILEEIDENKIMPPVAVIGILSKGGRVSMGAVRDYLKKHLSEEKMEIGSDMGLIQSYRSETSKQRKELSELSNPNVPRIFQVTRCSICSGQLELPAVHFMCRHSYHQRCLAETESHCPTCARSHGVILEIRKNNERFAGEHEMFLEEVRESDDGFSTISAAYGKGVIGLANSN